MRPLPKIFDLFLKQSFSYANAYETRFETVKTVFLKNHVDFHVFAANVLHVTLVTTGNSSIAYFLFDFHYTTKIIVEYYPV